MTWRDFAPTCQILGSQALFGAVTLAVFLALVALVGLIDRLVQIVRHRRAQREIRWYADQRNLDAVERGR